MSLQEAKQFVAHFVTGEYTPEEKAAFMQWLSGATVAELNIIADEHEALHDSWPLATGMPSAEWVVKMERKLDVAGKHAKADVEEPSAGRIRFIGGRYIGQRAWVAAASVIIILSTGAYVYLSQKGSVRSNEKSSEMRDREALLTNSFTVPRGEEQ